MSKEVANLQRKCAEYQKSLDIGSLCLSKRRDWRKRYWISISTDYATEWCDESPKEIVNVLMEDGLLFIRGFNQATLRCITGDEVARVQKEVQPGDWGEHQGGSKLFNKIMHFGYYWPTMKADVLSFSRRCQHVSSIVSNSYPNNWIA